jgi:HAD superfamily hydrolase (TIGR01509 family)
VAFRTSILRRAASPGVDVDGRAVLRAPTLHVVAAAALPYAVAMSAARFTPQAILFDMDGLLVDSEPVWGRAEQALMQSWGAPWTEADMHACRGTGIPETARRMAERAGRPFDPERDPTALVEAFLALVPTIEAKPGAVELVDAARDAGLRLAVASSSPRRVVNRVLAERGLWSRFEVIVTGDDVVRKKPDPAIFLLAAERCEALPTRCLVLEDSMPGVIAAVRASIPVIAVPEVDAATFEGVADAVVSDLAEARSLIAWPSDLIPRSGRAIRPVWSSHPMPEQRARLSWQRHFDPRELEALRLGNVPRAMEDRWFVYADGDRVAFHRSWTGSCIYELVLELGPPGARVREAWVNRDPSQYASIDDAADARGLGWLVDDQISRARARFARGGPKR